MRSHPVGLDVWCLVKPFVYFHTACLRTAKALARLRGCTGSPEHSLVAYVISTIITCAGSYNISYMYSQPSLQYNWSITDYNMGPVKWICVFEHSVMTYFNCACPAIQRGQGSGFLSEGSSWLTASMSERLAWTFAARIGDKYQIRLTRSI